ncbi:MAG: hypothetical protein HC893_00015 [Chloroflexaceae bacterium]|nr:hypothetical protein [Chloroflexaceae bacterium]
MAMLAVPQPIRLSVHYRDYNDVHIAHWTQVRNSLTKGEILPYALALCQAIEPVTDCEILGATLTLPIRIEYDVPVSAASDVSRSGVFIFESVVAGDRFLLQVPGFRETKFVAVGPWAGIAIDLTDPDVQAVVDLIVTGSGSVAPVSYDLNDLHRVTVAYRQHRGV